MRACPWCKEGFELVEKDGNRVCPQCRTRLVKKGEPGWDEDWSTRIGMDEYWISAYYGRSSETLVQITGIHGTNQD